jgi:hypothetical protein
VNRKEFSDGIYSKLHDHNCAQPESFLRVRFGGRSFVDGTGVCRPEPGAGGPCRKRGEYRWSSAAAHLRETDEFQLIDMRWWEASGAKKEWPQLLNCDDSGAVAALRASTYAGRPFGDEAFMAEIGARFGRQWNRGRPRKEGMQTTEILTAKKETGQFSLF